MDNIKFRGKRVDNGEWVYGSLVVLDYHNSFDYIDAHQIVLPNGHGFEVIPETVGQSTGLFDKNGVDIYEGDIVEDYGYKGVIKYRSDKYGCAFFIDRTEFGTGGFGHVEKHMEVIGNIHQHPELLK